MEALKVSPEFTEKYGQLMLTIGNEMNKLITAGDAQLLDEFIKSITFIMETVQSRIKEEYGTTPEAIFQDKGWSC
jgi:hypothetical protein